MYSDVPGGVLSFHVFGTEADALAEPIELDGPEALTLRVDKRHAQDRVQVEAGDGDAPLEALIVAHVVG